VIKWERCDLCGGSGSILTHPMSCDYAGTGMPTMKIDYKTTKVETCSVCKGIGVVWSEVDDLDCVVNLDLSKPDGGK